LRCTRFGNQAQCPVALSLQWMVPGMLRSAPRMTMGEARSKRKPNAEAQWVKYGSGYCRDECPPLAVDVKRVYVDERANGMDSQCEKPDKVCSPLPFAAQSAWFLTRRSVRERGCHRPHISVRTWGKRMIQNESGHPRVNQHWSAEHGAFAGARMPLRITPVPEASLR
jgi:hypothetical protein